jgi:hypothetical protein
MSRGKIVALATFFMAPGIAGCAPDPFDATAPVGPTADGGQRSFAGGLRAGPPEPRFAEDPDAGMPADNVTMPGEGGENPWATRPANVVVQICYGRMFNSRDDVDATARHLCPSDARLRYLGSDTVFNPCPLFQPSRAVYRCLAPESAAGESAGSG